MTIYYKINCFVKFCIIQMICLLFSQFIYAQSNNYIRISDPLIEIHSEKVLIDLTIHADHLPLGTTESLVLELTIEGKSKYEKELPPVVYTGKQRYLFNKRNNIVSGTKLLKPYYVHKGGVDSRIGPLRYKIEVPYKKWMKDGKLRLQLIHHDCCDKFLLETKTYKLKKQLTVKKTIPTPKIEPTIHSAMVSAYLNYEQARHDVLPYYKNNAYELRKVDSLLHRVMYNKNINIKDIVIIGYASPDGTFESNERLSRRRAEEFRRYIQNYYNIPYALLRVEWLAEDWQGLEKLVYESDIPGKYDILNIIRSSLPYDERDQRLKQLYGGSTYSYLLNQYYPRLRRIVVKVEYSFF